MATLLDESFENGTLRLLVKTSRLDAASAREFKKESGEIWRSDAQRLELDLSAVTFLDSSGVGALLSLYKKLPPENPSVKLMGVQPHVQSVIELLRLHRIFEITP